MPLQPLDDGPERKLAHSDRFALAMMIAGGLQLMREERVAGRAAGECPGAGRRRHAGGADVVLHDDRNAEQGPLVAVPPCLVGREGIGERRRTDRDHRVQRRVELADPLEIEVRQIDGGEPVRVHQCLKLQDRRRVDVDPGDAGVRWVRRVRREADRRRGEAPEHEGEKGCQQERVPKVAIHRVTSTAGVGGRGSHSVGLRSG